MFKIKNLKISWQKEDVTSKDYKNNLNFNRLQMKFNKNKSWFKLQNSDQMLWIRNYKKCMNLFKLWNNWCKICKKKSKTFLNKTPFSKKNLSKVNNWLGNFWEINKIKFKKNKIKIKKITKIKINKIKLEMNFRFKFMILKINLFLLKNKNMTILTDLKVYVELILNIYFCSYKIMA